jgi:cytochrome c oxidase cbb3-type subunit 2
VKKLVLIFGGSTVLYVALALTMGVWPGMVLSRVSPGPGVIPFTALQAEGRDVYVANGCSYCHTQQVRPLQQDKVFGRPSTAGDFAYQTPELLGSERTGPDLTNIGVRQPSAIWQYIHLYNPRAVVPQSIMPSFSWLFEVVDHAPAGVAAVPLPRSYAPAGGVVVPTHQAESLVAYLAALRQSPSPQGGVSGGGEPMTGDRGSPSNNSAGSSLGSAELPAHGYDAAKAAALFTTNCAACHQASGEGLPGAFPPLKNDAVVNKDDATKHIQVVLQGLHDAKVSGVVYGSVMPAFAGTLTDAEIADIIDYERSSWGNHGKPVDAHQVAVERAKAK